MLDTRVVTLSTMSRFQPQIMRHTEKQEDIASTKEKKQPIGNVYKMTQILAR